MDELQAGSSAHQLGQNESSTYVAEPTAPHTHTWIFLHGLGSNGLNFGQELLATAITSTGETLQRLFPSTRFVFPTAKRRRSSAFKRALLTQWFDIARLPDPEYRKEIQLRGLADSAVQLEDLIRQEVSKVPPQNVILGGISQGCAMSLSMLLALDYPLGGFIGMCSYLPYQRDIQDVVAGDPEEAEDDDPFATEMEEDDKAAAVKALEFERDLLCMPQISNPTIHTTASSTPVFLGHGEADEKKPYALGQAAANTLQASGYQVVWKLYPDLGHWYKVPDEIDDIVKFVKTLPSWESALVSNG